MQVNYSMDKMQIEQATAALDLINGVPLNMMPQNNVVSQQHMNDLSLMGNRQQHCHPIHAHESRPPSVSSSFGVSLFESYAAQFGLNKPFEVMPMNQPTVAEPLPTSVEAYAALMGIKLDGNNSPLNTPDQQAKLSQAQAHATSIEAMLKSNGSIPGTSITLPAGVGCGIPRPNEINTMLKGTQNNSFHLDPTLTSHEKTVISPDNFGKYSIAESRLVGSQTLAPEMLQSMIQNNMHNSRHSSLTPWPLDIEMSDSKDKSSSDTTKAVKSRERNRDHSRKSRLRKKVYVEGLKQEVKQLEVYRQICEQCLDLLAIVTSEASSTFTFASCAYSRVLGLDINDLVSNRRSFFDFVHADDVDQLKQDFKRLSAFGELAGNTTARVTDKGIICVTRVDKFGVK